MFKMDCLALFGRNILKFDTKRIDDVLRSAYTNLLTEVTAHTKEYPNH